MKYLALLTLNVVMNQGGLTHAHPLHADRTSSFPLCDDDEDQPKDQDPCQETTCLLGWNTRIHTKGCSRAGPNIRWRELRCHVTLNTIFYLYNIYIS
jgi:hypothetical protein